MICRQCKKNGKCGKPYSSNSNHAEICKDFEEKKLTNFEKIKNMSIDEMAEFMLDEHENNFDYCMNCEMYSYYAPHCISGNLTEDCIKARMKWLESEVKE